MPRIRSIKPEMFSDEKLAPLPVITRFVFVGLIAMADDAGRLLDNLKIIDAFLFPETSETARRSLDELSSKGLIRRGTTASGQKIVEIVNWRKHQRIDRANLSRSLPEIVTEAQAMPSLTEIRRSFDESSSNDRRNVDEAFDEASSTDREGEGEREREREKEKEQEQEQQPRAGARVMAAAAAAPPSTHEQLTADALTLTIAANQAIAVRFGEQPSPIIATHGTSHAVATALRAAGIPAAFGADVIADVVARTQFKRPPRSLGYFRAAIEEAWDAQQAHAQARSAARETSGAPNVRTAVGEYAPDVIRRRAEWWERLCFDRGWNHESSLAREGLLYSLEACGDVRDRAGFLAEWQVLKPHVDADLYRERTRGAVVAFFAEVLAAAVPPGAGPAAASAPARVAAEAAS
ncbi:MAG: hypothetical protein ABS52_16570 [Gemmatimonadetes bacterium SCN 70-22]|nr:MAG: hypothetical protein ABS52_16570 [Gemmatimonadetes bacterium SCN 70-22]